MSTQPIAEQEHEALTPISMQEVPDLSDPVKDPPKWILHGQTFTGKSGISLKTMRDIVRFTRDNRVQGESVDVDAVLEWIETLLPKLLTAESLPRFQAMLDDDDRPISAPEIIKTLRLLFKEYTGRPTQAQAPSPDGSLTTGDTLTELAPSTESIPGSSPSPG